MIEAVTMKRIARIKLVQRDADRARMIEAEKRMREAEAQLEHRHVEVRSASEAFGTLKTTSPADLELMARAVVESSQRLRQAEEVVTTRTHEFDEGRARRIETERDVRGLELARARMRKLSEARAQKEEDALVELRTGRRG
jgi:hypothetical protein